MDNKDWLDRATEPAPGGVKVVLAIAALVLIPLGILDFLLSLF